MKQIRRITAMLMAMMLIFTSSGVTSLAANESSSGATNPNQKGDSGIMTTDPNCVAVMRPAWLVYIEKINNDYAGEPLMSTEDNASMTTFSQCKKSAYMQMLYQYPKDFMSPDNSLVEHSFIVVDKGNASFNMNDVHVVMPADNSRPKAQAVYAITGNPPGSKGTGTTVISDDVLSTPEMIEAFRNSTWAYSDYEAALNHVGSGANSIEEAKKNFVNCFKDIGNLTNRIDTVRGETVNSFPQYADVIRNSITLNILAVISQLCPDPSYYMEYITDYLQTQNRDESSSFYVPVIIAGFICSQGGNESPAFYSLPAYLNKAYGIPATELLSVPTDASFGDYGDRGSSYENNFWEYADIDNSGKQSKYYANRVGSWFNYDHGSSSMTGFKGQAYTCMPTDKDDRQKGNLGYTYFAFGGSGAVPTDGIGQFKIMASSAQKTVAAKGTPVAAQLDVDLKCDATQLQQFWDTFTAEKAKGFTTADLIIEYSMTPVKGSGTSSPLIDSVLGAGTLTGGNKVTLSNMTYEKLTPYLKGQKTIQVADSNIIINESTTNKYLANVTLKFTDKSYKFYAKGKTIESTYVGSDKVSWSLGVDTPNKFHYYSAIGKPGVENNYVEIKEGSPGHESYEAMAGVPTTEDLYVGFGATEFMLNFDGEWKQNPEVTRTYTWSYTVSNCMEDDEPCKWSCPGHTVTVPSHKIQDEKKDSDGNIIQEEKWCGGAKKTEKCESGSVTIKATCPCGISVTKTFKAVGGDNGPTKCYGKDSGKKCWTGSGCVHSQKTNECHTHSHTWTGTINQKIAPFGYLDITDIDMWMLNECYYNGNAALTNPSNLKWDPNLGNISFTSQGNYSHDLNPQSGTDGNGRLVFFVTAGDQKVNNENIYGNTDHVCGSNGDGITVDNTCQLRETLAEEAWTAINSCLAQNSEVWCSVVSDYIGLQTSEGWQIPCYYSYDSKSVKLNPDDFTVKDTDTQSMTGNPITFSKTWRIRDMWQNNNDCASNWESTHITRSGYNGQYSSPNSKWDNSNVTVADGYVDKIHGSSANPGTDKSIGVNGWNKLAQAAGFSMHPNSRVKVGSSSYAKGFNNLRLTKTGIDIWDVMQTEDRTWPKSSFEPRVKNGEWDTGKCYLKFPKQVHQGSPGGTDYTSYESYTEVDYTKGKTHVNDIVVHNPVSTQNAYVICNDEKYDLRTKASLADGGDPDSSVNGCPGNSSCQYQVLTCPITTPSYHTDACYETINIMTDHVGGLNAHEHDDDCTHVHSFEENCYSECDGAISTKKVADGHYEWLDCGTCGYNPCIRPVKKWVGTGSHTEWYCTKCGWSSKSAVSKCGNYTLTCTISTEQNAACTNRPNIHKCTEDCKQITQKVLTCDNPHHIAPGEENTWDASSSACHYAYGDPRCWTPCNNDENHKKKTGQLVQHGNEVVSISDTFINIDREFKIYYPNTGDFSQSPNMHGILDTTSVRGMGYVDNMDCSKWTRDKYVIFPVNVIFKDKDGNFTKQASAYQPINLFYVPQDGEYIWTFYAVLGNNEVNNGTTKFVSIASNANTIEYYDESVDATNKDRVDRTYAARHTATKVQYIDVLGSIGGLALEDTGDFRFATLFKQPKNNGTWLIKNLVPQVNLKLPNKVLSDNKDLRFEDVSAGTLWHDAYSTQYSSTGGKAYKHVQLPLTPADNPIQALKKQPMRPGYNLYMDISTIGNYYGENLDTSGEYTDSNLYYKMQITPRYWLLNLDTNAYTPLDVYMGQSGNYKPVAAFDCDSSVSEYYLYMDWQNEYQRRNYTAREKKMTGDVVDFFTPAESPKIRVPSTQKDILGTAQRLFLNDLNRTFIGSTTTYGVEKNPETALAVPSYGRQAQRWNWTIGLPSSSVFVKAGEDCTTANIEKISSQNAVIVCTLQIYVKGEVWTLAYDGTAINNVDKDKTGKTGVKIFDDGPYKDKVYTPPVDPKTVKFTTDPIVSVYSNDHTSADDLRTEGSH